MIKRNRHKTSYRSSKKVNPKRKVLKKKLNKKFRRNTQGGIKWNGINNTVINTETVRLGWHVALTF
jgi:hypothetical protein